MKKVFFNKPASFSRLLLDTFQGTSILTLTLLRSELPHGINRLTFESWSHYTGSKLASLGATTWYKPRDI